MTNDQDFGPAPEGPFNQLMSREHLSFNDGFFGAISPNVSDVQGYVPASEYPNVRNGMTMPPGTGLLPAAQGGGFVRANTDQGGAAMAQGSQGGRVMSRQSHSVQQPPFGLEGGFLFDENSALAKLADMSTAMPANSQNRAFTQNNVNFGGHTMAQPNQGGASMTQQGHSSDVNMAGPGNQPVEPTASDAVLDISDEWSDFGYDSESTSSSRTLTPSIPIDPALNSNAPAQIPDAEVNGQEGRSTACGKGSLADQYPGGLA